MYISVNHSWCRIRIQIFALYGLFQKSVVRIECYRREFCPKILEETTRIKTSLCSSVWKKCDTDTIPQGSCRVAQGTKCILEDRATSYGYTMNWGLTFGLMIRSVLRNYTFESSQAFLKRNQKECVCVNPSSTCRIRFSVSSFSDDVSE